MTATKAIDVLGVGMITIDFMQIVDGFPTEGSAQYVDTELVTIGGQIGRSMLACSRFGGKVLLVGMVGTGPYADLLRLQVEDEGLDSELIGSSHAPSSQRSIVLLTQQTGSRTIFWHPQPRATPECVEIARTRLVDAKAILLDTTDIELSYELSRASEAADVVSIIDTGSYKPAAEKILSHIDHIVAPEKFFVARAREHGQSIPDNMVALLRDTGARSVVLTRGSSGGLYLVPEATEASEFAAVEVEAVDTNGAGDVFHGGFTYAVSQDWNIKRAIDFAAWLAARKCSRMGNSGLPVSIAAFTS